MTFGFPCSILYDAISMLNGHTKLHQEKYLPQDDWSNNVKLFKVSDQLFACYVSVLIW